jgi:hypothetical protein
MKKITKSALILCFTSAFLFCDVKSMTMRSLDRYMDRGFQNLRKNIFVQNTELTLVFEGYHVSHILSGYLARHMYHGSFDLFRGYGNACAVRQSFVGQPGSTELGTFLSTDREQLIVTLVAFLDANDEQRTGLGAILGSIDKCDRRFRIEIISAFLKDIFGNDEQRIAITAAFLRTETIKFLRERGSEHIPTWHFISENVASVARFKDYEKRMAEADEIVDRITARVAEERALRYIAGSGKINAAARKRIAPQQANDRFYDSPKRSVFFQG